MTVRLSKKTRSEQKFSLLAQKGEVVFHARDLANLWGIQNPDTLHTTLKRYVQKSLLFRVYKGMFSVTPLGEIDPLLLGIKALHSYGYVSCETVLARAGVIQQNIPVIMLVSSQSRTFQIGHLRYRSRKLADRHLFHPVGISTVNGIKVATVERAVADLLYFNQKTYFDRPSSIHWNTVSKIQKEIGYPIVSRV